MSKKFIFWWEFVLANQIRLLQNFALLLQIFALLLQIFALLLQIFALLLQIFALLSLLFGINCTEIDQSHSSIISIYIIRLEITDRRQEIVCDQKPGILEYRIGLKKAYLYSEKNTRYEPQNTLVCKLSFGQKAL